MDRVQVSSSNIKEIGYDSASQTLEVLFTNGKVYQYFEVSEAIHDALLSAASIGQYFNSTIRGVYRFARI